MNESSTRAETPGRTRSDLLAAARRCIGERGLAGATSREITAAAGANLAAITYHFGSKDALIGEALFGELEQRVGPALDALDGDGPPGELMLRAVQQLLEEFERSKHTAVVYLDALLLAARDPDYRPRVLALYSSIADRLARLLADLVADGVVPAWVDPVAMAALILAVANGIVLQTQFDPEGPDQVAMATQFAGLLLAAR